MPQSFHIYFNLKDLSKPFQCTGGPNQDNPWLDTDEKSKNVALKVIVIGPGLLEVNQWAQSEIVVIMSHSAKTEGASAWSKNHNNT